DQPFGDLPLAGFARRAQGLLDLGQAILSYFETSTEGREPEDVSNCLLQWRASAVPEKDQVVRVKLIN
ncbi:MAG TPA: hypothetical protein VEF04_04190, partial [Blastocatellia bacterium]|nr:hypothetical protein [Blastocatellia bacterium]